MPWGIVVSTAATGQRGQAGRLLRFVFWLNVVLAVLVGTIAMPEAYLIPGIIPK